MPVLETKGALSAQGYGLTTSVQQLNYIEDVFSTWLYTGNGSTQTITNGIDLAGRGGLVWIKSRSNVTSHALYDTARGATFDLTSNSAAAQTTQSTGLTGFLANGFSIGSLAKVNTSAATYVSWTFREQPRFFDIVTYTGNGANRTIAHNLGSVPGCIIVKRTDATADWQVYHRSLGNTQYMVLNGVGVAETGFSRWAFTTPTSTVFSLGDDVTVNASGGTYVAYIFAHNAGGFGATNTDNVISCGSFTQLGSAVTVNLGYEPQWLLVKQTETTGSWFLLDNMRGLGSNNFGSGLAPNTSSAETDLGSLFTINSTGFVQTGGSLTDWIYIAIRRGPMRTPTTGTSVFSPIASTAATGTALTTGFPVDLQINARRAVTTEKNYAYDRLRGISTNATESGERLITQFTSAETSYAATRFWGNTGFQMPSINNTTSSIYWNFRRAPGFFDVVCYTGDGTTLGRNVPMNLGVTPELVFIKARSATSDWFVGDSGGFANQLRYYSTFRLNTTAARGTNTFTYTYTPPVSTFGVPDVANVNGTTYVAYLFASCPGVSRVGSYTGTGATQVINCGFAAGARFILIKRTDSTGDWFVWDSARGIVAGNDPYLTLNTANAEVTNTDWVDTAASGFELSNAAGNLVNTNGGSYIFLAIA